MHHDHSSQFETLHEKISVCNIFFFCTLKDFPTTKISFDTALSKGSIFALSEGFSVSFVDKKTMLNNIFKLR